MSDKKVDVLFSFDTTGSMYPCLAEVRRRCAEVIGELFKEIPNIRIGIMAHGDYCDKHIYITKHLDLSKNEKDVTKFVKGVERTNGGDWSECYELVLHQAQEMDWRADADSKIFVMIGDATPHHKGYSYGGEKALYDWQEECKKLQKKGIVVYSVQAMAARSGRTTERRFYEKVAALTDGIKIDLHQLSHIIHLVRGVCYKQAGPEAFQAYEDKVKASGKLNRSIAGMLDALAGRTTSAYVFESSGDLKPVDPSRFQVIELDGDCGIKKFVVEEMGAGFRVGRGFYQWTKTETIQEKKEVILRDKSSGDMWTGAEAREMIGLPYGSRGRLSPKSLPKYDIFVQSTSWNRKLKAGTDFLYEAEEWGRTS